MRVCVYVPLFVLVMFLRVRNFDGHSPPLTAHLQTQRGEGVCASVHACDVFACAGL